MKDLTEKETNDVSEKINALVTSKTKVFHDTYYKLKMFQKQVKEFAYDAGRLMYEDDNKKKSMSGGSTVSGPPTEHEDTKQKLKDAKAELDTAKKAINKNQDGYDKHNKYKKLKDELEKLNEENTALTTKLNNLKFSGTKIERLNPYYKNIKGDLDVITSKSTEKEKKKKELLVDSNGNAIYESTLQTAHDAYTNARDTLKEKTNKIIQFEKQLKLLDQKVKDKINEEIEEKVSGTKNEDLKDGFKTAYTTTDPTDPTTINKNKIDEHVFNYYNKMLNIKYTTAPETITIPDEVNLPASKDKFKLLQDEDTTENILKQFSDVKKQIEATISTYLNEIKKIEDITAVGLRTKETELETKIGELLSPSSPTPSPPPSPPPFKLSAYVKFVELMVGGDKESTLSSDKGYLDHCMKILKSILKDNGGNKRMSMSKYLIREQYKKIKKLKDMSGAYIPDFFCGVSENHEGGFENR